MKKVLFLIASSLMVLLNCSNEVNTKTEEPKVEFTLAENFDIDEFNDYWNQGKAELSSYDITQARYGELRQGEAVLIFVTEPFSKSKQVKLDQASTAGEDRVDVLKLNFTSNFNTGIYPYSIMSSTFTPYRLEGVGNTIKNSMSMQEWCGQVFMQSNKTKDGYRMDLKSYFESEGDKTVEVTGGILEEELWNLIRIAPENIPLGDQNIIPSHVFHRFKHIETKAQKANISVLEMEGGLKELTVKYDEIERELKIQFMANFPYEIQSWEESYTSGWGANKKLLKSSGRLKERKLLDYWNRNSNSDEYLRQELGLTD